MYQFLDRELSEDQKKNIFNTTKVYKVTVKTLKLNDLNHNE